MLQGIELASIAALPPDVITRANEISKETGALRRQVEKRSKTNKVLRSRKVLLEVNHHLAMNLKKKRNAHIGLKSLPSPLFTKKGIHYFEKLIKS
jgi:DNA mismatch repair ATPase MutS